MQRIVPNAVNQYRGFSFSAPPDFPDVLAAGSYTRFADEARFRCVSRRSIELGHEPISLRRRAVKCQDRGNRERGGDLEEREFARIAMCQYPRIITRDRTLVILSLGRRARNALCNCFARALTVAC